MTLGGNGFSPGLTAATTLAHPINFSHADPPKAHFDSLGYVIIPDAIPRQRVLELAEMVRAFHADADRPLRGVPFMGGVSYPDFHRADRLREVFEALAYNHKVRRELRRVLGGPFRYLGHNDVGINVSIGWHKDRLNGPYRQFETVDPWSRDSDGRRMSIVKALIYLQDHGNDDVALRLVPGSHRFPSLERRADQEEILHPRAGDVILFDQRITHRGQLAVPTENRSRILVSLGFGRSGTHSDDFELGTRLRQDMFNDPACSFDAFSACALRHARGVLRSLRNNATQLKAIERRAEEEVQKLWAPKPLPRFTLTIKTGDVRNNEWEYTDQLLIFRYMHPNDRALMVGANIGGACVAMSAVAIDSTHITCVEPNKALLPRLDLNRARSNASFRIVHGAIVPHGLNNKGIFLTKCNGMGVGTCGRTYSSKPGSAAASSVRVPRVTLQELETPLWELTASPPGGPSAHRFTYVHLDCEGCACFFFRHLSQDRFRKLRAVSLELDGLEPWGSQCNYERLFEQLAAAGLERQPIHAGRTHAVFTRTQRPVPPLAAPRLGVTGRLDRSSSRLASTLGHQHPTAKHDLPRDTWAVANPRLHVVSSWSRRFAHHAQSFHAALVDPTDCDFLDIGGRFGESKHLAGRCRYWIIDIGRATSVQERIIGCDVESLESCTQRRVVLPLFDIVHSKDTFEHLRQPWEAMRTIGSLTRQGSLLMIAVPFAWRYHAVAERTASGNYDSNCARQPHEALSLHLPQPSPPAPQAVHRSRWPDPRVPVHSTDLYKRSNSCHSREPFAHQPVRRVASRWRLLALQSQRARVSGHQVC